MKPMLAEDWIPEKVKFPVCMQPKIDGVRALNLFGTLTGRSLKTHANVHTTKLFSHSATLRLDGEMAAGNECDEDLCRSTTSALSTIDGQPNIAWHIFDVVQPGVEFYRRHEEMCRYLQSLLCSPLPFAARLRPVPFYWIENMAQLEALDDKFSDMGYEGSILRAPHGGYKFGRSTVNEGLLLRIKHFIEEDALVIGIEEGQSNQNEATVNALGQTERSTHAENMLPNGMVGNFLCVLVKDITYNGKLLFKKGQEITVAPGKLPHDFRKLWFENQGLIVGKTIKFKTFPKGIKDKPRFPTFQSIRSESDKAV